MKRYLFKKHGLMIKRPKIYLILWRNLELRELTMFPIKLSIWKKIGLDFLFKQFCPIEKKEFFRRLWFDYSSTIGVRERTQSRWILLRRRGECSTTFGNIKVKQTLKPDGSINMEPENDEVLRLKLKHKISTYEITKIIQESSKKFKAFENWKWDLIQVIVHISGSLKKLILVV